MLLRQNASAIICRRTLKKIPISLDKFATALGNCCVHFFSFSLDKPFWTNLVQFELQFRTRLIWICRITWKISDVHFFCFRPEKTFLGKSGQKKKNSQFKLKFNTNTNLNVRNSMMMFTFSVFELKYLSWVNLVQKFKIAQSEI